MTDRSGAPCIPTCCAPHRLDAVEVVETMFVNDARTTFAELVGTGWSAPAALDAIRNDYRSWVLGRFSDAVDLGCDLIELEVAA